MEYYKNTNDFDSNNEIRMVDLNSHWMDTKISEALPYMVIG